MAERLHWYKRDPDAALAGMAELTLQERGAYNTILDLLYARDGNLPDDDTVLPRMIGCHANEWRAVKAKLIARGKIWAVDGKLTAKRVETELKQRRKLSETQRERATNHWEKEKNRNENNDPPMPSSAIPLQPHPRPDKEGGDSDARAREVSCEAMDLADAIAQMCGHDLKFVPPSWYGAAIHVQKWFNSGWRPDVIKAAVVHTIAKHKGDPIKSIRFFEQAIAREVAILAAPVPVAKSGELKIIERGTNGTHRISNGAGVGENFARYALRHFRAASEDG